MNGRLHFAFCFLFLFMLGAASPATFAAEPVASDRFGPDDLARLAEPAGPVFSPDGSQVVYSVTVTNVEEDFQQTDLWRVGFDGRDRVQLTFTPKRDEWAPAWSPDGRWLGFLADRGSELTTQVWAMPSGGGEARALTSLPGGVEAFAWSPDGRQLAVIAYDPELPPGAPEPKNPPPIVTERFYFKQDESGYLTAARQHLYLVDVATGQAEQLTSGAHDEWLPSWSPDGRLIAYVTKRGEDPDRHSNFDLYVIEPKPGATERRLTSFTGADNDPYVSLPPQWSPDSRRIAYLQGGEDKWVYYSPTELAIVDVATGHSTVPARLDRWTTMPRWSHDGRSVLAIVEHSRVAHLTRIDPRTGRTTQITSGARLDVDFAVSRDGRIVVLGGDAVTPYELAAVEPKGRLRPLGSHNAWLAQKRLARYEEVTFPSKDGTKVDGFVVKPVDYVAGRRYPTILRIHGGPVYQFSHEFMPDWQAFAARGFVVVAANPRGSSGRGFDFARAIYADWGNKDVQDVLAAVDHAVAAGVADPARLGVGGRSYGGILTNYVIASDQRFEAAVSGAGASHYAALYGHDMYTREYEFELGPPWRNREAYDRLSYPFFHADRIVTPTLFYCAEADFNVPCQGSEQMYQALRSLGVRTQLVVYPGEHHALSVPSYLEDRLERLIGWYERWLKPGG